MVSEDSVWCCIWSSFCAPPPDDRPFLNDYAKLTYLLIIIGCSVFCLFLTNAKRKATKKANDDGTPTGREHQVAATASHGGNPFATVAGHGGDAVARADSLGTLKNVLKKVMSQTNRVCAENGGEGTGGVKAMGSLLVMRNAIGEFVREVDYEQQQQQQQQQRDPGANLADNQSSPPPPPPQPPQPPPPALVLKRVHSATS